MSSRSLPRCAVSVLLRLVMRCQALWSILRQWFKESLGQLRRSVFSKVKVVFENLKSGKRTAYALYGMSNKRGALQC